MRHSCAPFCLLIFYLVAAISCCAQDREDEIVANLAGGQVIVHVAKDAIVFAAIDHPVERNSIPPRVLALDSTHIAVLFGASEWRIPSDPKPVRLDRNFQRIAAKDPRYQSAPGEAEPDLETIGIAFLEKLRPLVGQLHHKLDFSPDEPILQVVIIGYAPNDYGPEVWVTEYRIEQEQIATRGDYLQTRILRPRFTELYPPEKHAPRTIVESRYPVDAADFMRAVLPLVAGDASFVLGTMDERRGFEWMVPPDEPVEKAQEDKDRPPDAPTLRRKPKP